MKESRLISNWLIAVFNPHLFIAGITLRDRFSVFR